MQIPSGHAIAFPHFRGSVVVIIDNGGGRIIDLTEQPPIQDIGPQRKPRYTHHDHVSLVRAAIGNQPEYHDEYRFSGRTFKKRDVLTTPNPNTGDD